MSAAAEGNGQGLSGFRGVDDPAVAIDDDSNSGEIPHVRAAGNLEPRRLAGTPIGRDQGCCSG